MVSLKENLIIQGSKEEVIIEWQTWFMGPLGVTPNRKQAIESCERLDMDPDLCVAPIAVAVGTTLHEVYLR